MNPFDLAMRYVGIRELTGTNNNHPLIQWWLSLCGFDTSQPDETPWCSAFVNGIAWELRLPRSKSAAARSWLNVGEGINTPLKGDIIVLKRGLNPIQGHVGFYAGSEHLLGGNQSNSVCIEPYKASDVLGIRRIFNG